MTTTERLLSTADTLVKSSVDLRIMELRRVLKRRRLAQIVCQLDKCAAALKGLLSGN